jgi:hypothetical protein
MEEIAYSPRSIELQTKITKPTFQTYKQRTTNNMHNHTNDADENIQKNETMVTRMALTTATTAKIMIVKIDTTTTMPTPNQQQTTITKLDKNNDETSKKTAYLCYEPACAVLCNRTIGPGGFHVTDLKGNTSSFKRARADARRHYVQLHL